MVSLLPDDYRVKLSVFEGPIDLLLFLIRKKELDIHEISLSDIVNEYLDYVELMKLIDLERAGDFIVVATTLMKLKSRSLFYPSDETEELTAEEDPKNALIRYLLEFEKLGGAADKLGEKEEERRGVLPRGGELSRMSTLAPDSQAAPDYQLFDLLTAFRDVLKTAPKRETHDVEYLNITSEMKQEEILDAITLTGEIDFFEFVKNQPRIIIVVTFIAMLELIKNGKIQVRQSKQFGRIVLQSVTLR